MLILVTLGAAALMDFMPGSPGQAILGDAATAEQVDAINERLGYNQPFIQRYLEWVWNALHLDFGTTLFTQEPVTDVLMRRLAVTVELAGLALFFALVISIPLALLAAMRAGKFLDRTLNIVSSALLSIPSFVTVVLISLVFVVWLGWFPATGWVPLSDSVADNLRYAFLPAMALSIYECAFFYRVVRSDLTGTLREDFILVARAKGLPRRYILTRHALRPSTTSLITVIGLSLGRLLGGAVIVEYFFSVPGLGAEAVSAVGIKDMPMIQAIVTVLVVAYVAIFILVDLAYAWIDPRVGVR
ncbi:peptide/nickel transport system permease protein [Microbacterium thalassium]|uniref:Peptide/nickel transport system permease protein n=1 Tax=Microbacterium thalassium TaxID=362649 RepID=A0A7X0FNA8_9MICO|nr:peptide/nickel transport system permease protein [Microbacterium thalassium]